MMMKKLIIDDDRDEYSDIFNQEIIESANLLIKEEKQQMVIPYGDRSGVVIEPWLTDQWFCDAKQHSIDPVKSVKSNNTKFIPKVWEKTFFNWMENIQPWCISRQLWWGHQIPAWYGPDKNIFVGKNVTPFVEKNWDIFWGEIYFISVKSKCRKTRSSLTMILTMRKKRRIHIYLTISVCLVFPVCLRIPVCLTIPVC